MRSVLGPKTGQRTDIYPVGVLRTAIFIKRLATNPKRLPAKRIRLIKLALKAEKRFLWDYCVKEHRWRSLRNSFNGYLAEHEHGGHNAGRAWTKAKAMERVERICEEQSGTKVVEDMELYELSLVSEAPNPAYGVHPIHIVTEQTACWRFHGEEPCVPGQNHPSSMA